MATLADIAADSRIPRAAEVSPSQQLAASIASYAVPQQSAVMPTIREQVNDPRWWDDRYQYQRSQPQYPYDYVEYRNGGRVSAPGAREAYYAGFPPVMQATSPWAQTAFRYYPDPYGNMGVQHLVGFNSPFPYVLRGVYGGADRGWGMLASMLPPWPWGGMGMMPMGYGGMPQAPAAPRGGGGGGNNKKTTTNNTTPPAQPNLQRWERWDRNGAVYGLTPQIPQLPEIELNSPAAQPVQPAQVNDPNRWLIQPPQQPVQPPSAPLAPSHAPYSAQAPTVQESPFVGPPRPTWFQRAAEPDSPVLNPDLYMESPLPDPTPDTPWGFPNSPTQNPDLYMGGNLPTTPPDYTIPNPPSVAESTLNHAAEAIRREYRRQLQGEKSWQQLYENLPTMPTVPGLMQELGILATPQVSPVPPVPPVFPAPVPSAVQPLTPSHASPLQLQPSHR